VLKQLIEQARDLYDWIALLRAAFGEDLAKEWLANVNYRRDLLPISDCKNLFWARVMEDIEHLNSPVPSSLRRALKRMLRHAHGYLP
jgi:hypothetical protein